MTTRTQSRMRRRSLAALLPAGALLLACGATTHITHMWTSPEFKASDERLDKVLIIGLAQDENRRRTFEEEMKAQLLKRNVDAVASLDLMPAELKLTRENAEPYLKGKDIDAVLISRLTGVDLEVSYTSGYAYAVPSDHYYDLYGYYSTEWGIVHSPGYLSNEDDVHVETNVYRLSDEKLIWTGLSETFDFKDASDGIRSFASTIVPELLKKGLFSRSGT